MQNRAKGPEPHFYADEPLKAGGTVITGKVAKGMDFNVIDQSIEVRGTADPQGPRNADNSISPNFDHVEVKIRLVTDEPDERVAELKRQHFGRCPISALFRESTRELAEEWTIERP